MMCRDRKCKVDPKPGDEYLQCSVCGAWWFKTSQGFWQRFSS